MMWNDYDLTPEEQNAEHLRQNPALESSLWASWVCIVCDQDKIPQPTSEEWNKLKASFYHGKAPINSVDELKKMRS